MITDALAIRLATVEDIPALAELIPLSVRTLQAATYSSAQMESAIGTVFGVDRQLIHDGTYFVVEDGRRIVGCGGWSRRRAEFGADAAHGAEEGIPLDPAREPARIRAFFVHPDWARRGIGRALLAECESAARAAGFREAILAATLAGVPLYAAGGYREGERIEVPLPGGITLTIVRMAKSLVAAVSQGTSPS